MTIAESDWKTYKRLRDLAQERFSQRVLDECRRICGDESLPVQERHLELSRFLRERDREMPMIFDSLRRSTAVLCLMAMGSRGLLTDEEVSELSPELQRTVRSVQNGGGGPIPAKGKGSRKARGQVFPFA
jgi:hypothetical protein